VEGILAPWHWIILIVIIMLVFGPKKLPELGSSLGKGINGFKRGLKDAENEIANSMAAPDPTAEPVVTEALGTQPVAAEPIVVEANATGQAEETPSA
jgi:TatA/E family protein of Tat protein translocase